jgi:hypothetical protein
MVDAVGQIIDGAQAGAIPDVALVPADEVDGAAIVELFQIPQRQESRRARLRRDADDRNRPRPHQPRNVDRRDRGHGRRQPSAR